MAITTQMRTDVSQLYVALFGRAPDGEGLGYWVSQLDAGKSIVDIANAMYGTAPARTYYPSYLTNQEIVGNFYTNVLGRTADNEGLAYWTGKLNAAGATPGSVIAEIIGVVANYTGTDPAGLKSAALFKNKVQVAQWYGEQNGNIAGATSILSRVTEDPATVEAAKTGGVQSGQTFTLTQGVDTPSGTAGNDTFVAADHNKVTTSANEIFGLGDDINGGAGTDTLTVLGDGALGSIQLAKFASVEKANLTSDTAAGANKNVDLTSLVAGGLTDVTVDAGNTITLQNLAKAVNVGVKGAALANDAGVTFEFDDATTSADAISLSLNAATVGAAGQRVINTMALNGAAGIETVNVTAEGVSNVQLNSGNTMTTLNIAATGRTTIDANSTALATVNAAASTASVRVDATSVATATNKLAFTGGSGDDLLTVNNASFLQASATTSASTFDGATGTDEFVLQNDFDNTGAAGALTQRDSVNKLVGFEQFTVDGDATIDASRVTSVSKFGLQDTVGNMAGGASFTNLSNSNSIVVQSDYGWVDLAMATGQTVANLEVKSTAGGTDFGSNSIVNGVQTLNITSTKTASSHATQNTIGNLWVNNATNFLVNVSGDQDIRLGNGTAGNNVQFVDQRSTIDASTLTGKLNVNGSTDNDIIKGGSAADTIRGNLGADTLTGNGGNDTFVFGFGNTTAGAQPATAEIVNVTGLTAITNATTPTAFTITYDADKTGAGAAVTYTVNDTNGAFSIANDIADYAAAIQASLQTQIGANITVTAVDADTLRITDANGGDLTAATFVAPATPTTVDLNVADATDVESIAFTINGTAINVTGLTATDTEAGLAAAVQAAVRAANPAFAAFTVTEATAGDNILRLTDPAGSNLTIAGFAVTNDITTPAAAAVPSSTNIAFADLANFANTKEITIVSDNNQDGDVTDAGDTIAVNVSAVAGNGAAVAAAVQTAVAGSVVTWNQATLTLNIGFADGRIINELGIVADDTAGAGGTPSVITATEVAAGSLQVAQVGGAAVVAATATDNNDGVPAANYAGVATTQQQEGVLAIAGAGPVSESNINTLDTITDFVKGADKIDLLDFASGALAAPTKAWFAGDVTATAGANNLAAAIGLAVSDVNGATQTGSVALLANEAVLFQYAGNTYVLVNDGTAAYSPTNDVLVKITGSLGLTEGALTVSEFFA